MKVLMITGDARFGPGNERYELQKSAVDELAVVYWGRGALWPRIPKGRFDVVTAQDPFWRGHLAYHLARLKNARLNIQVHTDLDLAPPFRHIFAQLQLRHADTVRVVSEQLKQQVLRMVPGARVSVLPVFTDITPFAAVAKQPHEKKTILWIGRFEPEKEPLRAVDIVRHMPDTKLVMLGAGSLEQKLRLAAKGLDVEFPGWQDPKPYLARADAVLCTSRFETYGVSIIEALAARVAVVSPDVGIAREAGAIIAAREELGLTLVEVLRTHKTGELKLLLPTAQKWAELWRDTL